MKSWSIASPAPNQTLKLGHLLGSLCPDSFVILLEGDLGSGKTCFTQGVARGLGVPPAIPVNSPTYTLMNQYPGRMEVSHFDLYRLASSDELIELDFDSYLFGGGVTIVEWAGLVERKGVKGLSVFLDYGEAEDERKLQFKSLDPESDQLLQRLADNWKEA